MGKKISKKEITAIIWAIPILGFYSLGEDIGWSNLILIITIGIGLKYIYVFIRRVERREKLLQKYKDEKIVNRMMSNEVWFSQTAGQLVDSIGPPEKVIDKMLVTKKKEIWKYYHKSGNRYGLWVTLVNDVVEDYNYKP